MKKRFASIITTALLCLNGSVPLLKADPPQKHPNILFIIMDDVGIDQLRSFGYGGLTPPNTPVLDAVAHQGIRFRNVWAMPECSPSRAMFFEGRYPLRTNIYAAILSTDLANSQVSPYETTTPKILKQANYTSALFGKFHLAGPDNNPFSDGTPNSLGFDYFHGFLEGAPYPIDSTAGGVDITDNTNPQLPKGPYVCGFVPNSDATYAAGYDSGACYLPNNGGCSVITRSSAIPTPGRACLEQGGVFKPFIPGGDTSCQSTVPPEINFNLTNAYYVWHLVINDLKTHTATTYPLTDPRARTYSPTEETAAAIDWIKSQPAKSPWMATVAYSLIHSPYQQAPQSLTPGTSDLGTVNCNGSITDTRTLSDQMVEATDTQIGRLLVGAGIASQNPDGTLNYDPSASDTVVVIIGDNGTYAPSVKAPFDITHAKGFVNQTGVWVPLIVAGPLVNSPNRDVKAMVNVADLFELFGEIAGLNVHEIVPESRIIDSVSMLPYLTNPAQPSLRDYNFTQTGINISAGGARPGPCVIRIPESGPVAVVNTCIQLFPQAALCAQEGGTWYGPVNGQGGYSSCCALQNAQPNLGFEILPLAQAAIRNDKYKLIQLTNVDCSAGAAPDATTTEYQFFRINEAAPDPRIDFLALNLIRPNLPNNGLTQKQAAVFEDLKQQLDLILNSSPECPGDGNSDGVVDQKDINNWKTFYKQDEVSSWYDFPILDPSLGVKVYDGLTDLQDLQVIQNNFGMRCRPR